jgi:hypothetical protein
VYVDYYFFVFGLLGLAESDILCWVVGFARLVCVLGKEVVFWFEV